MAARPKPGDESPGEEAPKVPPKLAAKAPPKKPAPGAAPPAAAAKKPAAAAPAKAGAKSAAPAPANDTFKFRFNPEDAEERIAELIPENIRTDFGDANWKLRLSALEEMTAWLEGGVIQDVESELVVRFLAKKGWSEKNFQVSD